MINQSLFSSKTPEWETPQWLFDELNKEFSFILDVCATEENAKCNNFLTKQNDGLNVDWSSFEGWKWMNPPYGSEIKHWIKKAAEERKVVALLPARTDTKYFHDFIYQKQNTEIRFLKGRLKFGNAINSAPFPSMIIIFN